MIDLRDNFHIIESLSELPNLRNRKEIFCDVETQRNFDHKKVGGLYPWKGDRICGFSISADNIKDVWYIPIRHTTPGSINLPIENVMQYARDVLQSCDEWINHFVKFDAMMFDVGDDVQFNCRLICTLNLAKLYYSDRFEFGLKPLCRDWLDYDTGSTDRAKEYLDNIRPKTKSYADIPIRILGEYANDDVQMNRLLYRFLQKRMLARIEESLSKDGTNRRGDQVRQLIETEIKLTPVLFDMEKEGLRIDETECKIKTVQALKIILRNTERIKEITGRKEFTDSNTCIKDIFINQYKLPVLLTIKERDPDTRREIDTGRPSFDKDAMALYKSHPLVTGNNKKINEVVQLVTEYRKEQQFKSLFLDAFLELNVDGIIHPNYNQSVKTGRLSCSTPNSQQQNERSKALIHPLKGEGYLSSDYSQIQFRLIVHYCKIREAIMAYNEDPKTDYHQWVSDMLGMKRKPSKQLNFGMAFGQGKTGVTKKLIIDEDIMEEMGTIVNNMVATGRLTLELVPMKFKELCRNRAVSSYEAYHKRMPEIQQTSRQACDTAIERGFIFTAYARRRYLPGRAAYKAFNSIMQGTDADIMKERMVAISPRYSSESRKWGLKIRANVHDEMLNGAPLEVLYEPRLHSYIYNLLENTTQKFRVPILTGLGVSPNNWDEAMGDAVITTKERYKNLKAYKEAKNGGKFIAGKIR